MTDEATNFRAALERARMAEEEAERWRFLLHQEEWRHEPELVEENAKLKAEVERLRALCVERLDAQCAAEVLLDEIAGLERYPVLPGGTIRWVHGDKLDAILAKRISA